MDYIADIALRMETDQDTIKAIQQEMAARKNTKIHVTSDSGINTPLLERQKYVLPYIRDSGKNWWLRDQNQMKRGYWNLANDKFFK